MTLGCSKRIRRSELCACVCLCKQYWLSHISSHSAKLSSLSEHNTNNNQHSLPATKLSSHLITLLSLCVCVAPNELISLSSSSLLSLLSSMRALVCRLTRAHKQQAAQFMRRQPSHECTHTHTQNQVSGSSSSSGRSHFWRHNDEQQQQQQTKC